MIESYSENKLVRELEKSGKTMLVLLGELIANGRGEETMANIVHNECLTDALSIRCKEWYKKHRLLSDEESRRQRWNGNLKPIKSEYAHDQS